MHARALDQTVDVERCTCTRYTRGGRHLYGAADSSLPSEDVRVEVACQQGW